MHCASARTISLRRLGRVLASSSLPAMLAAALVGCSDSSAREATVNDGGSAADALGRRVDALIDGDLVEPDSAAEGDAGLRVPPLGDASNSVDAPGGAPDSSSPPAPSDAADDSTSPTASATFTLRAEWTGPCALAADAIDVNLGNAPESFVRAAYCQITGNEPDSGTISRWANELRTVEYVRRIDVVRTFCAQAGKICTLTYSNPWTNDPPLTATCTQKTGRDLGAVMMFFFGCPGTTNCGDDWANTHAWGMDTTDPIYGYASTSADYYNPDDVGFWYRELLDARYAGLQFVLPNVYGPDIQASAGGVANLEAALTAIDALGGGIRVGLFNDTWAWGEPYWGSLMQPAPDLSNTEAAAQQIYAVQWKPFFQGLSPSHWYTVGGRPLIFFYNAGTLTPTSGASAVIARMKQLFQADFGVIPFVDVDVGYGMTSSADAQFTWDTFANFPSTNIGVTTAFGVTIDNFMVKWDSLGRDSPGAIATASTRMVKGTDILEKVLGASMAANVAVLATWNDLGEGTGITRNYDYYDQGAWLTPDAFMKLTRAAQCSN